MTIPERIAEEVRQADERYGPFRSSHEGYGVLAEEMYELLEAIRENHADGIIIESIQVSAVARRLAESMDRSVACCRRSGCYEGNKRCEST